MRSRIAKKIGTRLDGLADRNYSRHRQRQSRKWRYEVLRGIEHVSTIEDARALLNRIRARWLETTAFDWQVITLPGGPVLLFTSETSGSMFSGYDPRDFLNHTSPTMMPVAESGSRLLENA